MQGSSGDTRLVDSLVDALAVRGRRLLGLPLGLTRCRATVVNACKRRQRRETRKSTGRTTRLGIALKGRSPLRLLPVRLLPQLASFLTAGTAPNSHGYVNYRKGHGLTCKSGRLLFFDALQRRPRVLVVGVQLPHRRSPSFAIGPALGVHRLVVSLRGEKAPPPCVLALPSPTPAQRLPICPC